MLSSLLSNSMKHGALDRFYPVSARRLYKSVWEIFRVDTHKLRDRRVFQGLKLVSENANSPQEVAGMAERWQV